MLHACVEHGTRSIGREAASFFPSFRETKFGSGGIRTKEQNKQSGANIIKALSKYYKGTKH